MPIRDVMPISVNEAVDILSDEAYTWRSPTPSLCTGFHASNTSNDEMHDAEEDDRISMLVEDLVVVDLAQLLQHLSLDSPMEWLSHSEPTLGFPAPFQSASCELSPLRFAPPPPIHVFTLPPLLSPTAFDTAESFWNQTLSQGADEEEDGYAGGLAMELALEAERQDRMKEPATKIVELVQEASNAALPLPSSSSSALPLPSSLPPLSPPPPISASFCQVPMTPPSPSPVLAETARYNQQSLLRPHVPTLDTIAEAPLPEVRGTKRGATEVDEEGETAARVAVKRMKEGDAAGTERVVVLEQPWERDRRLAATTSAVLTPSSPSVSSTDRNRPSQPDVPATKTIAQVQMPKAKGNKRGAREIEEEEEAMAAQAPVKRFRADEVVVKTEEVTVPETPWERDRRLAADALAAAGAAVAADYLAYPNLPGVRYVDEYHG